MNRYKKLLTWAFLTIVFMFVFLLFSLDYSSWRELNAGQALSAFLELNAILSIFSLVVASILFWGLRHKVAWMLVLFVLALAGLSVDLPERLVLFPENNSLMRALLTLAAIIVFWSIEHGERKFLQAKHGDFGDFESDELDDEITQLNLDGSETTFETKTKSGNT